MVLGTFYRIITDWTSAPGYAIGANLGDASRFLCEAIAPAADDSNPARKAEEAP